MDCQPPPYQAPQPVVPPQSVQPVQLPPQMISMELGNLAAPSTTQADRWEWRLFLKAGLHSKMVERIVVHLHPSFKVSQHVLTVPDATGTFWTPAITGWGVFQIMIDVHFKNGGNASLSHMLELATPMVSRHVAIPAHLVAAAAAAPTAAAAAAAAPTPWAPAPASVPQQSQFAPMQQQAPFPQTQQMQQLPASSPRQQMGWGVSSLFSRLGRGGRPAGRHPAAAAAAAVAAAEPITIQPGKPEDKKHTILALVLDRSGSMSVMGNEVEGGANAYLDAQRKADVEDGARTSIVMCTFDNSVETVHNNADLTTVSPITHDQVAPRGCTALYDGIGEALAKTAAIVNGLDTRPSVSVFILTDGQENSSQRYSKETIAAEITKLQKPENGSWDFYFAAANQDAMTAGGGLGMDREQCIQFSGKSGAKMSQTMQMTNMAYQRKKKSGGARKGWSQSERASCM